MPRPAERPLPEPRPRPTRLRSRRFEAGLRFERFSSDGTSRLLDPHEMADPSEHTGELRALLALGRAADLAQAERAERSAVLGRLPDHGTRLRDLQRLHAVSVSSVFSPSASASKAGASSAAGAAGASSVSGAL